jgi:hypothetical protein
MTVSASLARAIERRNTKSHSPVRGSSSSEDLGDCRFLANNRDLKCEAYLTEGQGQLSEGDKNSDNTG